MYLSISLRKDDKCRGEEPLHILAPVPEKLGLLPRRPESWVLRSGTGKKWKEVSEVGKYLPHWKQGSKPEACSVQSCH